MSAIANRDSFWMNWAFKLAIRAKLDNEVPVGSVIVKEHKLIGIGWNSPISDIDPTSHAEIRAIRDAAKNISNYRITDATLYVSLEPCFMCLGAALNARIVRVVFGIKDNQKEKQENVLRNLLVMQASTVEIADKNRSLEYSQLLQDFFKERR